MITDDFIIYKKRKPLIQKHLKDLSSYIITITVYILSVNNVICSVTGSTFLPN